MHYSNLGSQLVHAIPQGGWGVTRLTHRVASPPAGAGRWGPTGSQGAASTIAFVIPFVLFHFHNAPRTEEMKLENDFAFS